MTILLVAGFAIVASRASIDSAEDTLAARRAQFAQSDELAAARSLAPFRLRYPISVPAEAELEHVAGSDTSPTVDESAIDDPTGISDLAGRATPIVGVDMYWILPNEGRLHMWQTNDPAAATRAFLETADPAPAQGPFYITLPNGQWRRIDFYWGADLRTSLNRLFEDGVFVSLSGEVTFQDLSLVAGSLQQQGT